MAPNACRPSSSKRGRAGSVRTHLTLTLLLLAGCVIRAGWAAPESVVRVGSKSFTESYILGEIIARIIEQSGETKVNRRLGLGGTGITYRAIANGDIDIYPEYTGTITRAILQDPSVQTVEEIRRSLKANGLTIGDPLGFNNTYALAVRREMATRLELNAISDLGRHPGLTGAFSAGFLERDDGWPGLSRHYGLKLAEVRLIEHALVYEALAQGKVDVIDVFSTDGKIDRLDLQILRDDRGFFPSYEAVLLVREDFIARFPATWQALQRTLAGRIDHREMAHLNALADLEGKGLAEVGAAFLGQSTSSPDLQTEWQGTPLLEEILVLSVDHLYLVILALAAAAGLGIPMGIAAARFERLAQLELMSIGVLQTIPSLALLCFMIPLFGIGKLPALVALFLYALLPIVRNTYTGMISLDRRLREIAIVLGLNAWQRLLRIELPLASMHIMAGVKTSAVFTVGTATLAAFIGGGGYGTLIVRGLALDDLSTILAGAVPAALMAMVMHGLFEVTDRFVIPRGLRKDLGRSI